MRQTIATAAIRFVMNLWRHCCTCNALHFRRLKFGCNAVWHTTLLSQLYSFATAFFVFLKSSFHSLGYFVFAFHYTMLHSKPIFAIGMAHSQAHKINTSHAHIAIAKPGNSAWFRDSELRNPFKEALRNPSQLYSWYARLAVFCACETWKVYL